MDNTNSNKQPTTDGYNGKVTLTRVFQKVPEGYIGFVEELPGANTQGETLEETQANLEEAIELVLESGWPGLEERSNR